MYLKMWCTPKKWPCPAPKKGYHQSSIIIKQQIHNYTEAIVRHNMNNKLIPSNLRNCSFESTEFPNKSVQNAALQSNTIYVSPRKQSKMPNCQNLAKIMWQTNRILASSVDCWSTPFSKIGSTYIKWKENKKTSRI